MKRNIILILVLLLSITIGNANAQEMEALKGDGKTALPRNSTQQITERQMERANPATVIDNGKEQSETTKIEVKEIPFKKYILQRLRAEHKKGNFLDLTEEEFMKLSEQEIKDLLEKWHEETNEDLTQEEQEYIKELIEKNARGELDEKTATKLKVLGLLGLAGVGANMRLLKEKGNKNQEIYQKIWKKMNNSEDAEQARNRKSQEEWYKELEETGSIYKDKKIESIIGGVWEKLQMNAGICLPKGNNDICIALIDDPQNPQENAYSNLACGIAIDKNLIEEVKENADEIAFILAHEVAHIESKDQLEVTAINQYCSSVSCTPKEEERIALKMKVLQEQKADSTAFNHIVKAGFNPGAEAATMFHMTDFLEKNSQTNDVRNTETDHPAQKTRITTAFDRLNKYSGGRVKIEQIQEAPICSEGICRVYKDNEDVFTGNSIEACFKAGSLAKDCHEALETETENY